LTTIDKRHPTCRSLKGIHRGPNLQNVRGVLHVPGTRADDGHVLGQVHAREARRQRSRVPRVGRRLLSGSRQRRLQVSYSCANRYFTINGLVVNQNSQERGERFLFSSSQCVGSRCALPSTKTTSLPFTTRWVTSSTSNSTETSRSSSETELTQVDFEDCPAEERQSKR
jgi:hypothetical protein